MGAFACCRAELPPPRLGPAHDVDYALEQIRDAVIVAREAADRERALAIAAAALSFVEGQPPDVWLTTLFRARELVVHAKTGPAGMRAFNEAIHGAIARRRPIEPGDGWVCSVCLDDARIELVETKCSHIYHFKCLGEWTKRRAVCPMCESVVAAM